MRCTNHHSIPKAKYIQHVVSELDRSADKMDGLNLKGQDSETAMVAPRKIRFVALSMLADYEGGGRSLFELATKAASRLARNEKTPLEASRELCKKMGTYAEKFCSSRPASWIFPFVEWQFSAYAIYAKVWMDGYGQ